MRDIAIQRWNPERWDELVGNHDLRKFLFETLTLVRTSITATRTVPASAYQTLLVTGGSGAGKSCVVKLLLRCLGCQQLGADMNPCQRTCSFCQQSPERYSVNVLWSRMNLASHELPVDIMVVDAAKCQSKAQLLEMLAQVREWTDGLGVVFFDEAHRLQHSMADELLLTDMEQKNVLWLFATAHPKQLDPMFRRRCTILKTKAPTPAELEGWITARCRAWGISFEPTAVKRAAARCNGTPALCIPLLNLASIRGDGLTVDLVENHWNVD